MTCTTATLANTCSNRRPYCASACCPSWNGTRRKIRLSSRNCSAGPVSATKTGESLRRRCAMIIDRADVEEGSERMAIFTERIAALFERLPVLCGFHVTEGLAVVEITFHHGGLRSAREARERICVTLEELLDDVDHGVELLRGKTFARAIH